MKLWAPVSSNAYGANAVYIPEYGKPKTLEIILVMYQNYPEFKTHPVLDVFHGYIKGIERFDESHEMRVVGWEIVPAKNQWSFLYFPTMNNDVKAMVTFSASPNGHLRMEISMENPSSEDRQWEFHLYVSPCEGLELKDYSKGHIQNDNCSFGLNGIEMSLKSKNITFWDVAEVDSNMWFNFPLNAEIAEDPDNPKNRYKKRLRIRTKWIDLPSQSSQKASIDFLPDGISEKVSVPDTFNPKNYPEDELPWRHSIWEAYHNRQYARSCSAPEKMTIRPIPAHQWGRFFMWDGGLTATAIADFDEVYADAILAEMPNPLVQGDKIFNYGSFIITAIYALWELYRSTGKTEYIEKHYDNLKRLLSRCFDTKPGEDYDGLVSNLRGGGADDCPAMFYGGGFIFTWDFKKTLPIHPEHVKKTTICIGLSAHALRQLKIMRIFAHLLGKKEDMSSFSQQIDSMEKVLNEKYWSEKTKCYLDRLAEENNLLDIPWIYDYLPLFSDSVPDDRKHVMFKELMKTKGYFTDNGFTIIKPDSPYYRREGYPNGSVWPPLQYFFWKACINMGEMDAAKEIASRFFRIFEDHHKQSLCCCEHFRAETGLGEGNMRFSGFMTPIAAMHKAHHAKGAIQTGYETLLLSRDINENHVTLKFISPFFSGKTGFSVVLEPEQNYLIKINGKKEKELLADENGWLGIDFNIKENVPVSVELTKKVK